MSSRNLLTVMLLGVLVFVVLSIRSLGSAREQVARMGDELAQTKAEARRLEGESNQLHVQIREVEMLYDAARAAEYAANHYVSTDGRIEMVTWLDGATHQLCAHWCARQDPGGPCLPSGPDRCIP